MTSGKIFVYGLLYACGIAILKLFSYNVLNIESVFIIIFIYLFILLGGIAMVRRIGIINYLESIIIIIVWLIFSLILDVFTFGFSYNLDVYTKPSFYGTYLIIITAVFFFHKKRHIDIRKGGSGK